jgi:hypothetical protein
MRHQRQLTESCIAAMDDDAEVCSADQAALRCTCANVGFRETTPPFATSRRPAYAGPMLIDRIASDAILDQAYAWLCHWRKPSAVPM